MHKFKVGDVITIINAHKVWTEALGIKYIIVKIKNESFY